MMTSAIDLVIMDVAGTTIRDGGQVASAFEATLAAHGVEITDEELRPWRGASKRRALAHFIERRFGTVETGRMDEIYAAFRDRLREQFAVVGVQPLTGAEQTFAWLRARGVRLALTTGFDREVADMLFGAMGWDGRTIDAFVCGDEVLQGRPAPYMIFRAMEHTNVTDVRRVVNVGDTALDLESAWNAGVGYSIGVLSGAHGRDQLQRVPHTHLLASVADLPALLDTVQNKVWAPT